LIILLCSSVSGAGVPSVVTEKQIDDPTNSVKMDLYVLYVYYGIEVNGVWLSRELENIIIEVK
jgi:hypothetical protein